MFRARVTFIGPTLATIPQLGSYWPSLPWPIPCPGQPFQPVNLFPRASLLCFCPLIHMYKLIKVSILNSNNNFKLQNFRYPHIHAIRAYNLLNKGINCHLKVFSILSLSMEEKKNSIFPFFFFVKILNNIFIYLGILLNGLKREIAWLRGHTHDFAFMTRNLWTILRKLYIWQ